jgi:hypothetical protein
VVRIVGWLESLTRSRLVRPLALAALLLATTGTAATVTAATLAAQTTPPPAAPPIPQSDPLSKERRISIAGTTIAMRPSADGFQEATLTATAARLFAVLPEAFHDIGLTAKELDQNTQQAGTGTFRAQYRIGKQRMSTFIDCGLDGMGLRQADSYGISMRVTTQIVPEGPERATVRTLVQSTGRPASNSGLEIHCPSLGTLEQKLAEAVAARANR